MGGKVALVTGGTSGIGKAVAEGLKRDGAKVVVLARDPAKAAQAGFEDAIQCDLSSQASVRKAASEFLANLSASEPDDEDFLVDSARAWNRIKILLEANLTDLTFVRIGPADEDGTMAIDAGAYPLLVLGRTVDGKVAGFFVVSVET